MIIGFTGKAGAGKSTASNYLVEKYGFVKVNFKDALVREMKENLPDVLQELTLIHDGELGDLDFLFNTKPPIMRALMQNYGTEIRRKDNSEYWINKWSDSVIELLRQGKSIVVDDVRFLNEAAAVKSPSGKLIRILRDDVVSKSTHQSEVEQDLIEVDYTIYGKKGEHETLYRSLDKIIDEQDNKE